MRHGVHWCAGLLLLSASRALAQTPVDEEPPAEPSVETEPSPAPTPPAVEPSAPPEVSLPPPAPTLPLPAKNPPAAETQVPEPPPQKVAVGKEGFWKPGLIAQVWAFATHSEREWQQTSFRLRRLEMKWAGDIIEDRVGYAVVIDPARLLEPNTSDVPVTNGAGEIIGTARLAQPAGATSIVQDAVVTVMSDYADVSIGQFKIPVSYEALTSVGKLLFPERSTVSRRLGERRDMGLKVEKKFTHFGYLLAAMNGEGQNRLDTNDQKDVALRLEVYPMRGLTLAGVGYTAVGERHLPNTKDRAEADLRFEEAGLLVQGEYIRGWDRLSESSRVTSQGFYGVLGYTFAETIQPLVRFGYFDPNVKRRVEEPSDYARLDEQKEYSAGLTYYWLAHEAKFQLATSVFDYDQAPSEVTSILCAQASF